MKHSESHQNIGVLFRADSEVVTIQFRQTGVPADAFLDLID